MASLSSLGSPTCRLSVEIRCYASDADLRFEMLPERPRCSSMLSPAYGPPGQFGHTAQLVTLNEYLGEIAWYIDPFLSRSPQGMEVLAPPHRWRARTNWKVGALRGCPRFC